MRQRAALLSIGIAVATAVLAVASPANAALPGFEVNLSAPGQFKAGAGAKAVQAVVSTATVRRCQKVRWSMLLRVSGGVTFDDVKVTRIENGGEFPLQSQISGDTARLTDVQLDPGQLCRGSTVTARYDVSFGDDTPAGQVSYQIRALNVQNVVLQQAAATSRVDGEQAAPKPSPTPTPTESKTAKPSPSPSESDEASAAAVAPDDPSDDAAAALPTSQVQANATAGESGVPSLLGPGLIVGALFVFVGIGILLRLRLRSREPKGHPLPTSFYPTH